MFVLVVVRQHEEQLAWDVVFFVVGFVCACCYLGADCLCGLPFSCDVFDLMLFQLFQLCVSGYQHGGWWSMRGS